MKEVALVLGKGVPEIPAPLAPLQYQAFVPIDLSATWDWALIVDVNDPVGVYADLGARNSPAGIIWLRARMIGPHVGVRSKRAVATWIVLVNPAEEREVEFNEWFDNRHIHDTLAVPGFFSAQRFRLDAPVVDETPRWTYLALYEVSLEGARASRDEAARRAGTPAMPNPGNLAPGTAALLVRPRPQALLGCV